MLNQTAKLNILLRSLFYLCEENSTPECKKGEEKQNNGKTNMCSVYVGKLKRLESWARGRPVPLSADALTVRLLCKTHHTIASRTVFYKYPHA